MLNAEIKQTLLGIKFREEMFEVLDQIDYPARLLISQNIFQKESRYNKPFGLIFTVPNNAHLEVETRLKGKLPTNYSVYVLSEDARQVELAIVRPTDKYELVRIMGTNSETKHNLDTGTLVARLRRWEEEYGLTIIGAGPDWVKFKLERIPGELREFSREVAEFAPNTYQDLRTFEQELKDTKTVLLRWS